MDCFCVSTVPMPCFDESRDEVKGSALLVKSGCPNIDLLQRDFFKFHGHAFHFTQMGHLFLIIISYY